MSNYDIGYFMAVPYDKLVHSLIRKITGDAGYGDPIRGKVDYI